MKSNDEKERGDLPVGAPFFNPFSLIFIALIEDLFLEETIKSHDGHSDSGNSSISMRAMHIYPYFMRVYSYMLIDDDAEERRYYALLSSIKNAPLIPCFVECRRQR